MAEAKEFKVLEDFRFEFDHGNGPESQDVKAGETIALTEVELQQYQANVEPIDYDSKVEATAPEATAPEATAPEATAPEATAPEATA